MRYKKLFILLSVSLLGLVGCQNNENIEDSDQDIEEPSDDDPTFEDIFDTDTLTWPTEEINDYVTEYLGYTGEYSIPEPSLDLDYGRAYIVSTGTYSSYEYSNLDAKYVLIQTSGDFMSYYDEILSTGEWETWELIENSISSDTLKLAFSLDEGLLIVLVKHDYYTEVEIRNCSDFYYQSTSWPEDKINSWMENHLLYEGDFSLPVFNDGEDHNYLLQSNVYSSEGFNAIAGLVTGDLTSYFESLVDYGRTRRGDYFYSSDMLLKVQYTYNEESNRTSFSIYQYYYRNWPSNLLNAYISEAYIGYLGNISLPAPNDNLLSQHRYFPYAVNSSGELYVRLEVEGDFSSYGDDLVASNDWYYAITSSGYKYYHSSDFGLNVVIYPYDEELNYTRIDIRLRYLDYFGIWPDTIIDDCFKTYFDTYASLPALDKEYFDYIYVYEDYRGSYPNSSVCFQIYIYANDNYTVDEIYDKYTELLNNDENYEARSTAGYWNCNVNDNYAVRLAISETAQRVYLQIYER